MAQVQRQHNGPPRAPTSALLEAVLDDAPDGHVTLGWLMDSLRERSFGIVMLLLALIALLPGMSPVAAVPVAAPAVQMSRGRSSPALPRFVAARPIPVRRLARLVRRAVPVLRRAERIVHPRWPAPFVATERAVGGVLLRLGVTLPAPIPFSHVIPALTADRLGWVRDGATLDFAAGAH